MFAVKIGISACLIAFASWLSGKRPELAGFIIALPLTTLLALAFSYAEYRDPVTSVTFAKSVFVGVPVSLGFFIPFLFAEKFNISFVLCYGAGIAMLVMGYFLHKQIVSVL